jgi:GNAT superfamily N-acetyltransferase
MKTEIAIEHVKRINATKAVPFLVHAWNELLKAGFCDDMVLVSWDHEAVLALNARKDVIAAMSFSHIDWRAEICINIGFVMPAYRRRRVYRRLFARVVDIARERGVTNITGGRHVLNSRKARVDKSMGRKDVFVFTSYIVPEKGH